MTRELYDRGRAGRVTGLTGEPSEDHHGQGSGLVVRDQGESCARLQLAVRTLSWSLTPDPLTS